MEAAEGMVTNLQSLAGIVAPPVLTAIFGYFISEKAPVYLPGAAFFFRVLLIFFAAGVAARADRQ
ncbi:MAG: hypothetical protein AAGA58_06650 [Verrucomicrobiota bacterium]